MFVVSSARQPDATLPRASSPSGIPVAGGSPKPPSPFSPPDGINLIVS
jgi:hypothetical protein